MTHILLDAVGTASNDIVKGFEADTSACEVAFDTGDAVFRPNAQVTLIRTVW